MTPIVSLRKTTVVIFAMVAGNTLLGQPLVGIAAGVLIVVALGIGTLIGYWLANREQRRSFRLIRRG